MSPQTHATVHVVGLGLSGLAAAVRLVQAGASVRLYEGAGHAGGRCRSFEDNSLGVEIDNGNHLLLSGNTRTLAYLDDIGARDEVKVFERAAFPFVDLASGERWCIDLGDGRAPWWLFDRSRRVGGVGVGAHIGATRILFAGRDATVCEAVRCRGVLFERFWEPMSIAVLNTRPERGSAALLRRVLAETFGRGGRLARPVVAKRSLGRAFVSPALSFLQRAGAAPRFHARLKVLELEDGRVARLRFEGHTEDVAPADTVVLALPPSRLQALLPGIPLPGDDTVIANAHFRVPQTDGDERIGFIGLTKAKTQWVFRRPGLISTTISAAHELGTARMPPENLLDTIWSEVRAALRLPDDVVPAARRLIREKRATFDQSPAGVRLRPATRTALDNLFLAGDVVDNGLPATIEGAIRNGEEAARRCLSQMGRGIPAAAFVEAEHA